MSDAENIITVKILDRTYNIKCPPEQAPELQASANYLTDQMRKMRLGSNNSNAADRIAVVAALNITHELMLLKKQKNQYIDSMHQRIRELQERIQKFLATKDEVEI
jgi:cell division protein ZapA